MKMDISIGVKPEDVLTAPLTFIVKPKSGTDPLENKPQKYTKDGNEFEIDKYFLYGEGSDGIRRVLGYMTKQQLAPVVLAWGDDSEAWVGNVLTVRAQKEKAKDGNEYARLVLEPTPEMVV